ncbi:MAG: SPFH domain-containing protein [Deltaproteobacteria bacterium]|nr:MAG: SPFH domain-containing protein [Deltaproteobacteria bacterium]
MGIFDFVKGGVKELAIARPDAYKDHIVYKHPDKTIPMKAQLTVEPDEICLFFRDGEFVGQFTAGRHTLDSGNIPFLGRLIDKFTGGDVFIAEVYFVTTREITDNKFGGRIGKVRDPQSGLAVEIMVHGTFSVKVIDPPKLVIGLVGLQRTDGNAFLSWFKEQILKTIRDDIAELIVKKKWPLLDVTSGAYTEEIEQEVVAGVRTHVEPYGLEVIRMGNFHVGMSDADEARLTKFYENAAYINMTGGMQGYQQFAQANMMMNAGEGMAKGGGGSGGGLEGAGLGLGFAMANQMMNPQAQNQPAPQPNTPPSQMNTVQCGKCNAQVAPGKFCSECGAPLQAAGPKFCSNCGKPVSGKFCGECGTPAPA